MPDTILDITWSLLLAGGYKTLSIDAIAREGSISKRTIYDRFESKVGLLVAAIERGARDWAAELQTELDGHREGGGLKNFILRMLEMVASTESVTMSGFMAVEGRSFPQLVEMQRKVQREVLADLSASLGGVVPGYPKGIPGELLARSVVALLDGWGRTVVSLENGNATPDLKERIYLEARAILTLHGCDLSNIP